MFSGLAFKDVFPLNKPNFLKNKSSDFCLKKQVILFTKQQHVSVSVTIIMP
jgi:hypothetical protein